MTKYFYTLEGRTLGPVKPKDIMSLILEDKLDTNSYVMDLSSPKWVKINEIPELMKFLHESNFKLPSTDEDISEMETTDEKAPLYYYLPLSRLVILCLVSFGLFEVYWLYRNWRFLRYNRKRKTSLSFWRVIVNPFAIVGVFYQISKDQDLGVQSRYRSFTANGWFWLLTLILFWFVSNGVVTYLSPANSFLAILASLALLGASVWCIYPVQSFLNSVNAKLDKDFSRPTFGHYALVVLGVINWIIVLWYWLPIIAGQI